MCTKQANSWHFFFLSASHLIKIIQNCVLFHQNQYHDFSTSSSAQIHSCCCRSRCNWWATSLTSRNKQSALSRDRRKWSYFYFISFSHSHRRLTKFSYFCRSKFSYFCRSKFSYFRRSEFSYFCSKFWYFRSEWSVKKRDIFVVVRHKRNEAWEKRKRKRWKWRKKRLQ